MAKRTATNAISTAVQQLKQEHIRLCKELERVDEALSALGSLGEAKVPTGRAGRKPAAASRPKRKISSAARKKMSEAARARWAARRKEKSAAEKK